MASITIYVPDQEPIALALDVYEQVSIGRGPDNDVIVDHDSLSGSHAVIHNVGGVFHIQDLGSTNGTFVNGEAVTETQLANGYRVYFGGVEAVFEDATEAGDDFGVSSGGSGYSSGQSAEIATASHRPADFKNLSPVEKVVKKNPLAQAALIVGILALLAAITVVVLSTMIKAA